jgi:hypothetical protein
MSKEREFDLQDRFIDYAVRIIKLDELIAILFKSVETAKKSEAR